MLCHRGLGISGRLQGTWLSLWHSKSTFEKKMRGVHYASFLPKYFQSKNGRHFSLQDCYSIARLLKNKVLKLILSNSESNFSNKKKDFYWQNAFHNLLLNCCKRQLFTEQPGAGPEWAISEITVGHIPIWYTGFSNTVGNDSVCLRVCVHVLLNFSSL